MKIKHKLTGQELQINFHVWVSDYLPKKLDRNYQILEQDTVFLRRINNDGTRSFETEIERADALKIVKNDPYNYDFLEQQILWNGERFDARGYILATYDEFKSQLGDRLKESLDEAYFYVTGKYAPVESQKVNENLVADISNNTDKEKVLDSSKDIREGDFNAEEVNKYSISRVFKLSIGPKEISEAIFMDLMNEGLVTVHNSTNRLARSTKTQFQNFSEAQRGDYFYLCRGNEGVILFGQFADDLLFYSSKEELSGWGLRKFTVIKKSQSNDGYNGEQKWWTPNQNSTFTEIPRFELDLADRLIFLPFFDIRLSEIIANKEVIYDKSIKIAEIATSFKITDTVDGVIGVKSQAEEISELIISLDSNQGMIGIFGQWGRGKSFLWREMKSYLLKKNSSFVFADYHAWRYQDTPASWAYLYESIVKVSTDNSEPIKILFFNLGFKKNVFRFNLKKHGFFPLIFFVLCLFASLTWFVFIPFNTKIDWLEKSFKLILSSGISISVIYFLFLIYIRYAPKAIDLFKKYSKLISFKNLLGIQSEIQEELIQILEASFPNPESKRILLFVDDLDRCPEDKIISIIDSFRVMLESPAISERVVVVTAIDERVLKRAISQKYLDSISKSFDDESEKKRILETLVREYMDKLFISGIRLSGLTLDEKEDIFDAFSKNRNKVNFEETTLVSEESSIDLFSIPPTPVKTNADEIIGLFKPDNPIFESGVIDLKSADPDYEIEEFEYQLLKIALRYHVHATPRSIRIYYYRYLLAKRLMKYYLPENSTLRFLWNFQSNKKILPELIIFYSMNDSSKLTEIRKELDLKDNVEVEFSLFDETHIVNRKLLIELYKIIEMVVPY